MADEETEYVSDPEEAKLSLKMRRREASDDEEEDDDDVEVDERENRGEKTPIRRIDDSDGESEGAAADYEEDDLEGEGEEDYDLDEEYVEEEVDYVENDGGKLANDVEVVAAVEAGNDGVGEREFMEESKGGDGVADGGEVDGDNNNAGDQQGEEKKVVEPYAVPTAGAFYMHDDRFRDNSGGGRNRRMLGGRRLWESKDERKWGHDKFEELTSQERHHDERRRGSRGRYRGRGRSRGPDRGYARGTKPKEYANNGTQNRNNQNNAPKGVRGRGPRRYQPSFKNDPGVPLMQNKETGKSVEKSSYSSSVRTSEPMSNAEAGTAIPRKQVSASNLSIASPPFYPSGSSAKDNNGLHKRDAQAGSSNRSGQPLVDEKFAMAHSTEMMRGKNKVDSIGIDNLYIDDSLPAMAGKSSNTLQVPRHGQGRGITSSRQMSFQSTTLNNQVNRVPPLNQLQNIQRNYGPMQASAQQSMRVPSGTQVSSPPKASVSVDALDAGELESVSESGKSKNALVAKGKNNEQGSGRGSFIYGGAQVMGASGNMGSGRGDQNFPTFLPVMQFGGQHPGGIGVPAVGMAFPGYVGGQGSSEMTWLPVLAGAAGALGANFCPPYLTVDGSYHARPAGQPSSAAAVPSKENNATKVGNEWSSAQKPELASDESGQRQKNPRRYTEMKFDQ